MCCILLHRLPQLPKQIPIPSKSPNMSFLSPSFVDVVGLAGTALTTIGFLQANWPSKNPEGATVKIKGMKI